QPVVARGLCDERQLGVIHNKLESLLGAEGAYLDAIYYCPHHPARGFPGENSVYKIPCRCRKPAPGLIEEAARSHRIDLSRSIVVGDSTRDIAAGHCAGLTTILLRTGHGGCDGQFEVKPDQICGDIGAAINWILARTSMSEIQGGVPSAIAQGARP